jgi:hypothetical protein
MEIKFIEDGDFEKSNDFHNQFRGTRRNLKQWKWEFATFDKNNLPFVVAKKSNDLLGTIALIPIKLIDKEGIFPSAKAEEGLVHPSLRGQGVLKDMYDLLFKYALKNNIHVIWGFTAATKAHTNAGFHLPGNTSQIFMPLSSKVLTILVKDNKYTKFKNMMLKTGIIGAKLLSAIKFGIYNKKININNTHIDTRITAPLEAGKICEDFVKQWGGVTIYRDSNYLQWRIFDNPYIKPILKTISINSKLVGWIIYSVGDDYMGYIIDLMVASPDIDKDKLESAIGALLCDAVTSMKKIGAVGIRGWSVSNHPFNNVATKIALQMGFYLFKKGEPIVMYYNDLIADRRIASIKNIDNWYITRIFTEGISG